MLQEYFLEIMNSYSAAKNETFANHKIANMIRSEIPNYLHDRFSHLEHIIWNGSSGKGRWSDVPWIAGFNKYITTSATEGFYPIYIFSADMRMMYLSLMQGMTHLENIMSKREAIEALKLGRKILLHKITLELPDTFSAQNIELHAGTSHRPKMYPNC